MSNYRRLYIKGGCYFFTVVTDGRKKILTTAENITILKRSFNKVKIKFPFEVQAMVIMPDHLHCIWELPENDFDFSTRWRLIKQFFTKEINKIADNIEIWQRRYWEHLIRNEKDWQCHIDYIHYNPVKHGYVLKPLDWP